MKSNIKKILREGPEDSNILFSAVVLDDVSRQTLLSRVEDTVPHGWNLIAHHMTIAFGKAVPNQEDLGKEVTLTVTEIGLSDMAVAVKVSGYSSVNEIPHITIGVNPEGGTPAMSKEIQRWVKITPFQVKGVVTEFKKKK